MRGLSVAAAAVLLLCGCQGKTVEGGDAPHIPSGLPERAYPPSGWAWGALKVAGAPTLRYGVAAPDRSAKGQVLILPDAREPAEAWFETANDLLDRGYTVWTMDWAGQGGSARWAGVSDRLYAVSLDPDVIAVRRMVSDIVRPKGMAPLILLGDGLGAQLALRALADGAPAVGGAVLGSPALSYRSTQLARPFGDWGADLAGRVGFSRPFVAGEHSWTAPVRIAHDRTGVTETWMQANPGLRVGGASLAWTAAYNRSAAAARAPAALSRTSLPVVILADTKDGAARDVCFALKSCRFVVSPGGTPHLAADAPRQVWLNTIADFIAAHSHGYVVGGAPMKGP